MRSKIIVLMLAALLLAGCFGKVIVEDVASITLSAPNQNIVEPGKTIKITAVGRSEDGKKTLSIEPEWTLDDPTKGTITQDNPAEFTAAADATGEVTITAKVGEVEETITLIIAVPKITSVAASWGWEPDAQGGVTDQRVGGGSAKRGGYDGSRFFTGFNDPEQWVEWNLDIPEEGQYRFIIRYSTHQDPQFVRRNFTLREAGADLEAAYIDETYDLAPGRVDNDVDGQEPQEWKFFMSEPLELTAGNHTLRMTFVKHDVNPVNVQFSNVVQVGFVAADPTQAVFTQAQYIEALDRFLQEL
jgi:hypothetical protein